MKSSAGEARRKWRFTVFGSSRAAMAVLALLVVAAAQDIALAQRIPLPLPRPVEAGVNPVAPVPEAAQQAPEARQPPQQSACRIALTEALAIAPSIPDIKGEGGCGGEDLVRLEAVVLPDAGQVPLKPAAILRCDMASAVVDWVRTDVNALARELGTRISGMDNFNSYECRGRNRVKGAKVSEHGRGNALDLRGVNFANGQSLALTEVSAARELRDKMLVSMCGRFSTVLGPGSDGYHEDHIHIDLAPRRNNYKICQWMVWDELPKIAPLLPADRPGDAPPRELVAAADPRGAAPAVQAPVPEASEPEVKPEPAPVAAAPLPRSKPANLSKQDPSSMRAAPPVEAAAPKQILPKQGTTPGQVAAPIPEVRPKHAEAMVLVPAPPPPVKPRKKKRAQPGPVMPWDFLR